jgi:hypothetical protein
MPSADLMSLITTIVAGDKAAFDARLRASPALARDALDEGATRRGGGAFFVPAIGRYLMAGDTALHIAAAAHRPAMARALLAAGADVRARNRRGAGPLHAAACGRPGAADWNPVDQAETVAVLIAAGADPNVPDKGGAAPLHKAVRTRAAAAVDALIAGGADPGLVTKGGTSPLRLAELTTGRSGAGVPEAKAQQALILRRLRGEAGMSVRHPHSPEN